MLELREGTELARTTYCRHVEWSGELFVVDTAARCR